MGKRVQKVLRPHEDEPEMEDMGIPGKLYFDKPQVINLNSYRKSAVPNMDPVNRSGRVGPEELYQRETAIRMRSITKIRTKDTNFPETVEYALSQRPSQDEAQEYIRVNKINGFGEGAIITRRWQEHWKFRWHGNWGMIVRVIGNVPWNSSEAWSPYVVQWFERPDVQYENAWAEDLVLIHTTLDKDLLVSILEAQGIVKPGS